MSQRFSTRTITAVGSYDFQWDFVNPQNGGLGIQWASNSNWRGQILMSDFDDGAGGTFTDITSFMQGGANISGLSGLAFQHSFFPHRIRINVDSLAGTAVAVAIGL